mgnify:CR=1 FL=1
MGNVFEGSDKLGDEALAEKERIYKIFNDAVLQFKGVHNYIKGYDFLNAIDLVAGKKFSGSILSSIVNTYGIKHFSKIFLACAL